MKHITQEVAYEKIREWRELILFMKDEVRFFQDLLDHHFERLMLAGQMEFSTGIINERNSLSFSDIEKSVKDLAEFQSSIGDDELV